MQDSEILKQIIHFWSHDIPFNNLLGINITKFDCEESEIRFLWKKELVGNPVKGILHGGVTATALDFVGGIVVAANMIFRYRMCIGFPF